MSEQETEGRYHTLYEDKNSQEIAVWSRSEQFSILVAPSLFRCEIIDRLCLDGLKDIHRKLGEVIAKYDTTTKEGN